MTNFFCAAEIAPAQGARHPRLTLEPDAVYQTIPTTAHERIRAQKLAEAELFLAEVAARHPERTVRRIA